ncbi:unnamed protein product, partial [marine sediment metagenome]
KIYNTNKFFSSPLEYDLITFHGVKLLEVSFSPFKYNPVGKIVKVCPQAELVIGYNVGTENRISSHISSSLVEGIVERVTFDGDISSESQTIQTQTLSTGVGGKFVIVSHDNLINTATYNNYINYRENQGYVHLETIDTSSSSFDEPEEIRTRLLELYQDPGFEFLLLIGDETFVPISHETEVYYRDKLYSRLDGEDSMPDVFMGRFLTDNEIGFQNILDHQIDHEAGGLWTYDVMMTWGIEHYGGDPDIADRFSSSHYSTLIMDNPNGGLGYNVHRFYMTAGSIPTRYGGYYSLCGIPLAEFEPWTLTPNPFYIDDNQCTSAIINRWNEGAAIIGHRDHSNISGPYSPRILYII